MFGVPSEEATFLCVRLHGTMLLTVSMMRREVTKHPSCTTDALCDEYGCVGVAYVSTDWLTSSIMVPNFAGVGFLRS